MKHIKFIGITGGVGAGKTEILSFLDKKPGIRVMLADEIAHMLMCPGQDVYERICEEFQGEDIFVEDGKIESAFDSQKLGNLIFSDIRKRERLNKIVHPAVKEYVKEQYKIEQERGKLDFLFLEAALLIEEHYNEICDELWYIYTNEKNRRIRLKLSRNYSDDKIDGILRSQLTEAEFRKATSVVIDNNGSLEESFLQIENALEMLKENSDE